MEKRINEKIDDFMNEYNNKILDILLNNKIDVPENILVDLREFINNHDNLNLTKEDFSKRKRCKTNVPIYLRCCAKRANGEQCTRKKKDNIEYCGTHEKNKPHGIVDLNNIDNNKEKVKEKIEIFLEEINGITYYIDNNNNIYNTQDIIQNIVPPRITGKYKINSNNDYVFIK